MSEKLEISQIVSLMIGFFVLFIIVEAIYTSIDDAVNNLNLTMGCGEDQNCSTDTPYPTAGNLVVYGWKVFQYVVGLGALILAGMVIVKKAKSLG